eukprot:6313993-Amphidinium_carterae.1
MRAGNITQVSNLERFCAVKQVPDAQNSGSLYSDLYRGNHADHPMNGKSPAVLQAAIFTRNRDLDKPYHLDENDYRPT